MTILIVGGTGATGRHLVKFLLDGGHSVRAIVRSPQKLIDFLGGATENLTQIQAAFLDLSDADMEKYTQDCDAIASCLGHNLTFKGIYGKPRRLVTDSVRRLCQAVESNQPGKPVRFVLMNTTGNRNRDLDEPISVAQRMVIALLRLLLPPHVDNEKAADYLRIQVGQEHPQIEWAAVRPDGLIDENEVSAYEIHPSPIRSAIFDAGQVSRINVAHFMADLITKKDLWQKWKGQMPVIYSSAPEKKEQQP